MKIDLRCLRCEQAPNNYLNGEVENTYKGY